MTEYGSNTNRFAASLILFCIAATVIGYAAEFAIQSGSYRNSTWLAWLAFMVSFSFLLVAGEWSARHFRRQSRFFDVVWIFWSLFFVLVSLFIAEMNASVAMGFGNGGL